MITSKFSHLIIHIFLIAIGIIWIYPFVWMVSSSLKTNMEFLTGGINPIPREAHWENYVRAWITANFQGYFLNTVIITLSVVLIVIILSSLTGYALGRVAFPGRKIVIASVVAVTFVPKGYTIIPLFQLIHNLGLTNTLLGVIVAESSGAHVLFILLFAAFFSRIPKEIEESAIVDGCGFFKVFLRIILPMGKPVIATAAIMQFIWTWSSFLIPLVLTLNKPSLRTLSVGMLSFMEVNSTDFVGMTAGATIALIPVIVVFVTMQRYFIEGISGAVKQ